MRNQQQHEGHKKDQTAHYTLPFLSFIFMAGLLLSSSNTQAALRSGTGKTTNGAREEPVRRKRRGCFLIRERWCSNGQPPPSEKRAKFYGYNIRRMRMVFRCGHAASAFARELHASKLHSSDEMRVVFSLLSENPPAYCGRVLISGAWRLAADSAYFASPWDAPGCAALVPRIFISMRRLARWPAFVLLEATGWSGP